MTGWQWLAGYWGFGIALILSAVRWTPSNSAARKTLQTSEPAIAAILVIFAAPFSPLLLVLALVGFVIKRAVAEPPAKDDLMPGFSLIQPRPAFVPLPMCGKCVMDGNFGECVLRPGHPGLCRRGVEITP